MSDKKITDLQLRSNVNADVNLPADDGIQTYRVTAPQVAEFALAQPRAIVYKTSNHTAGPSDHVIMCDASGGSFAISLPTAVGIEGKIYKIKRSDLDYTGVLTINPDGSELIEGSATFIIPIGEGVDIISDNVGWIILSRTGSEKFIGASYKLASPITPGVGNPWLFDDLIDDALSIYNVSTGVFTIPKRGRYLVAMICNVNAGTDANLYLNGAVFPTGLQSFVNTAAFGSGHVVVNCDVGDELDVRYSAGAVVGTANTVITVSRLGD